MAKQTYLFKRNGTYYFRMVVPHDLQTRFGKRELVSSLRTEIYRTASKRCVILGGTFNELFIYVRKNLMLTKDEIKGLCRQKFTSFVKNHREMVESDDNEIQKALASEMSALNDLVMKGKEINPFQPHLKSEYDKEHFKKYLSAFISENKLQIKPNTIEYAQVEKGVFQTFIEERYYHYNFVHNMFTMPAHHRWFADIYPSGKSNNNYEVFTSPSSASSTNLVSEVLEKHLAEVKEEEKSKLIKRTAVHYFTEWIGDKQIHTITKADARTYKDNLMKMPKNPKKKFPDKTIKELPLGTYADNEKMSITTINSYLTPMVTLFNWAKKNWDGLEKENPFSGMAIKAAKNKKDARRSFSSYELKTIFSNPLFTGCQSETTQGRFIKGNQKIKDEKYWIPLFALLTGARMNEICQVNIDDVYNEDGLWLLDINENGQNKKLKSDASERRIPLHSKLIEIGLPEYIEKQKTAGHGRLFHNLNLGADGSYSQNFSKSFQYFLRKKLQLKDTRITFHSFRHGMADALRSANSPDSLIKSILGHEDNSITANYGSQEFLGRMKKYIEKVDFDINWDALK